MCSRLTSLSVKRTAGILWTHSPTQMMEAAGAAETSAHFYQTTRRHIQKTVIFALTLLIIPNFAIMKLGFHTGGEILSHLLCNGHSAPFSLSLIYVMLTGKGVLVCLQTWHQLIVCALCGSNMRCWKEGGGGVSQSHYMAHVSSATVFTL